jgi:glucose-1-phosphate adenylyltransferase
MKTRAVILAGGEGSRLEVLTSKRTKPAVPFGGKYRIIDFTLSNCVNSGIFDVMILAQYRPHSLIEHIGSGGPWDLDREFTGGVRMYSPYKARRRTDWYLGTADAVQQNFSFIKSTKPNMVLILSGDHIYEMNYDAMIAFHLDHQAEVTMATIRVPIEEASRFGIVGVDDQYRVKSFIEKPAKPTSNLVNMGVYLFNYDVLDRALLQDSRRGDSAHDFGKNILPSLVDKGVRVIAYPYSGYWVDVGTIDSYWQAHMDLLLEPPPLDMNDRSWVIHTRTEERPPVRIQRGAQIIDSLITDGCVIGSGAIIEKCVLSPGVSVAPGTILRESIILTDSVIGVGATVERTILDKRVIVGQDAHIGKPVLGKNQPVSLVGKNSQIPPGIVIEAGAMVYADVRDSDYPAKVVRSNEVIKERETDGEI